MKPWITNQDIYLNYRFKKRDVENGKVWYPYIKKEDSSDHKYSLTFRQWQEIIKVYFEVLLEKLIEGHQIVLPYNLGILQIMREKRSKRRGDKLFRNLHTFGFSPTIAWYRHRPGKFRRKYWYKFNLSRRIAWKKISNTLFEEPSVIYNFDINSNFR